ncbi:AAA family ATPase, partial [Sinorhizobium meliloti]
MTISKIHIENIRGFEKVSLTVNLRPNCTNILVAPNGFGKSSICTAFNCARGSKLNVDEKDKHKKKDTAVSRLSIEYDGNTLHANSNLNEISGEFDIHVIKSNIEPKAKLPKINGFTVAKPYLEIPS